MTGTESTDVVFPLQVPGHSLLLKLFEKKGGADIDLEQLYVETRSGICSYLLYLGVPSAQALEVTHEVFLRLHQSLRKSERIENPRAWLYRVAHNLAYDLRAKQPSPSFAEPDWERLVAPHAESPETKLISRERMKRVRAVIATLSAQQKSCLHLRADGLRHREIAEVLGISMSSVNEFLRRALVRLAEAAND